MSRISSKISVLFSPPLEWSLEAGTEGIEIYNVELDELLEYIGRFDVSRRVIVLSVVPDFYLFELKDEFTIFLIERWEQERTKDLYSWGINVVASKEPNSFGSLLVGLRDALELKQH